MARHQTSLSALLALLCLAGASACSGDRKAAAPASAGPSRGGSLTATIRSQPTTFNRFAPGASLAPVDVVSRLTQASLIRVNRVTGEAEPWLAEKWTTSADGRTFTLTLRDGITFSDGHPFSSDDVVFTFRALYDPEVKSSLEGGVRVQNQPLQVSAPDPRTVVVTLPAPFAPGVALLDNVPILPKHLLQAALDAHTFGAAWGLNTPPASMAGLGPFVIGEFVSGQRMTFTRNPRYWRKDAAGTQLPYLDSIVLQFVTGGQDAEMLRFQSGAVDVMTIGEVRAEDVAALRRLRDQGSIQLLDAGTSVDPLVVWFNLTPGNKAIKAKPYLQQPEFRQAISYGIDRDAIVKTLFLGAAAPAYGPVSPGNKTWYSPSAPTFPHDSAKAKALLAGIGLTDRNNDGMLDDANGQPVRVAILVQTQTIRERTMTIVQEQLRQVGVGIDVVGLDVNSIFSRFGGGDYESICHAFQASSFDPAMNLDFWLSGGDAHVWNFGAPAPWEKQIDALMQQQVAAPTLAERQRLLLEVEKIFAAQQPEIYVAAPQVTIALGRRVGGAVPALLEPKVLWNAEALYVKQ